MTIRVTPFQLMQWKAWLRMEIRRGKACRHSSGRSVKAHAARHFGLRARAPRELVLQHVEAALAACKQVGAPLGATVELSEG